MAENKIAQHVIEAVNTMINTKISKLGFNQTITAKIVSIDDPAIGLYTIEYQGSKLSVYSAAAGVKYTVGDTVYINVPNGDLNSHKIIIGKEEDIISAKQNNILWDREDNYAPYGELLYNNEIYASEESQIYQLENTRGFIIKGTFYTDFMNENGIMLDGYNDCTFGIQVTFESGKVYVFNQNDMIGDPYRMGYGIEQFKYFPISKDEAINKIKDVQLYIVNKPTLATVTVENLQVYAAAPGANVRHVQLEAPDGFYFQNDETISIKAFLKENTIDLSNSVNLKYYWFRKNLNITPSSGDDKYSAYGGDGWELLSDEQEISIGEAWAPLQENQFKVVIIDMSTFDSYEKEFKIFNKTYHYALGYIEKQDDDTLSYTLSKGTVDDYIYQWYIQALDGEKTKIEGETSNSLNIALADINYFSDYYCKISSKESQPLQIGEVSYRVVNMVESNLIISLSNDTDLISVGENGSVSEQSIKDANCTASAYYGTIDISNEGTWNIEVPNIEGIEYNPITENSRTFQLTSYDSSKAPESIAIKFSFTLKETNTTINKIFNIKRIHDPVDYSLQLPQSIINLSQVKWDNQNQFIYSFNIKRIEGNVTQVLNTLPSGLNIKYQIVPNGEEESLSSLNGLNIILNKDDIIETSTGLKITLIRGDEESETVEFIRDGENGNSLEVQYQSASSKDDLTEDQWSPTIPTVSNGQYIFMRQKISSSNTWSDPMQISGQDGAGIEFVYYRSEDEIQDWTGKEPNENQANGWRNSPQGIDIVNKYEYVSLRTKASGQTSFGPFSSPVIWSKWGEKGLDGDGLEYQYCRTNGTVPTYPIPQSNYSWTPDPLGVTEIDGQTHEYVVQIKTINSSSGTETEISNVALWAKYGKDGKDGKDAVAALAISLSNDKDLIPASSTGSVDSSTALGGAATEIALYKNGMEDTSSNPDLTCVVKANGDIIEDGYVFSNKKFQLTTWKEDWNSVVATFTYSASVEVNGEYKEVSISKNFVMTKIKTEPGKDPIDYYLEIKPKAINTMEKSGDVKIQVKKQEGDKIENISGQSGIVVKYDQTPISASGNEYIYSYDKQQVGEIIFSLFVDGVEWDTETLLLIKDGFSVKDFNISASSYVLVKDINNQYKNTITLTAHLINIDASEEDIIWETEGADPVNGKTIIVSNPGTYTARIDNTDWSDSVTIGEVEDGAVGKDAIAIVLSNPTMTFHKETENEVEECEIIVYEGGHKLTLVSSGTGFTVTKHKDQDEDSDITIEDDTVKVKDKEAEGSYKITVNVITSTNEESSQDFVINWKVISDGAPGKGIQNIVDYFQVTNIKQAPGRYSSGTTIDSKWKTKLSEVTISETAPYLWNFERTYYTDGSSTDTNVTLLSSEPRAIASITEYYAKENYGTPTYETNNNSVNIPTGWETSVPTLSQKDSLYNCEVIKYTATDKDGKNLYKIVEPAIIGYLGEDGDSAVSYKLIPSVKTINDQLSGTITFDILEINGSVQTILSNKDNFILDKSNDNIGSISGWSYSWTNKEKEDLEGKSATFILKQKSTNMTIDKESIPFLFSGENGKSLYILDLDNESVYVKTNADGIPPSQASSFSTNINFYYGTEIINTTNVSIDNTVNFILSNDKKRLTFNWPKEEGSNSELSALNENQICNITVTHEGKTYQKTFAIIINRDGVNGTSSYTMSLDNDSDVITVSSASGNVIGNLPVIAATTFYGEDVSSEGEVKITAIGCKPSSGTGRSYTMTEATSNTGKVVFEWRPNGANTAPVISKTFTFKKITSPIDYDLIIPQTNFNITDKDSIEITVNILRKSEGVGAEQIAPGADSNIKIQYQKREATSWINVSNESVSISDFSNSYIFRIVKADDEAFIWDEEIIEFVRDGDSIPGWSSRTIQLYKRSASEPISLPSGVSYNFKEKSLSGTLNGWSLNIPDDNGSPCYITAALATSNTETDDIEDREWSEPVIIVESGTSPTVIEQYALAGWTDKIADTNLSWNDYSNEPAHQSGVDYWYKRIKTTDVNNKVTYSEPFLYKEWNAGNKSWVEVTGTRNVYLTMSKGGELKDVFNDGNGNLFVNANILDVHTTKTDGTKDKQVFYASTDYENHPVIIGGFEVNEKSLYNENNGYVYLGTDKIGLGEQVNNKSPFEVTPDGNFLSQKGQISNWRFDDLTFSSYAENDIYKGIFFDLSFSDAKPNVLAIGNKDNPSFRVTKDGILYAKDVQISGTQEITEVQTAGLDIETGVNSNVGIPIYYGLKTTNFGNISSDNDLTDNIVFQVGQLTDDFGQSLSKSYSNFYLDGHAEFENAIIRNGNITNSSFNGNIYDSSIRIKEKELKIKSTQVVDGQFYTQFFLDTNLASDNTNNLYCYLGSVKTHFVMCVVEFSNNKPVTIKWGVTSTGEIITNQDINQNAAYPYHFGWTN